MKASVILAHPYEKSFNHAIFDQACASLAEMGLELYAHDLYRERFDPVLTVEELGKQAPSDARIKQYIQEMVDSRVMVFVHPNWWGQPPAMMKGYIDRVFRPPYAYDFPAGDSGGGLPIQRLAGKTGIVFNTSNTSEEREKSFFHDPLEHEWIDCVFGFCGITDACRRTFSIVSDSELETRKKWLDAVNETIKLRCGQL
jgi:putative NADPH-quinone reductase